MEVARDESAQGVADEPTVQPSASAPSTTYRLVDGDRIHLNLDAGRVRLQHIRRDPRVALSVIASEDWYTHASIQGRVTEIADDPDLSGIDALARHYTGESYPTRDRPRVNAWVEIEHVHVWGRLLDN